MGMFICLAIYHFFQAKKKIKEIKSDAQVKAINGLNLGISEFIKDFNSYVGEQNKNNKRINIIQGIGYTVAALTALYSFLLFL